MKYTGAVQLFEVTGNGRVSWVLADTGESACDEVATRNWPPFEGMLQAAVINPRETVYFVNENPSEVELLHEPTEGWGAEPTMRAGFVITQLTTEKYRVAAPAWRWAEAYEATLEPYAIGVEPKLLGSH